MPIAALGLILLSACIHVLVHLAFKRARRRLIFVWWLLLVASVVYLPLAGDPRQFPPIVWGIVIVSGALDAAYFATMGRAYAESDLSVAYPLARGSAPLLLVIWSSVLLKESPAWGGVAGIVLVALGLYIINLPDFERWADPLCSLKTGGPRWALLAGLCISLYTAVDKVGVGYLPALQYTYWVILISWVWLTPLSLAYHRLSEFTDEWRTGWLSILIAGLATMAAYGIVMGVVRGGVPVAYAGAAREISVVLGVLAGAHLLGEPGFKPRLVGASCVALGVALIGLMG